MGQVGHGQVDHENDGFPSLPGKVAQDPQSHAVCQETRDEDDGVGGCVQGCLESHGRIGAIAR